MYYDTQLLPLDNQGRFLLARHYARFVIGGEVSRESHYGYFALGHIDHPDQLQDITALCTLPRPASKVEHDYYQYIAEIQGGLSRDSNYGPNQRAEYAANQQQYLYAAQLATHNVRYVPRRVACSRNGHILLGFELSPAGPEKPMQGLLRLVDSRSGNILLEESSKARGYAAQLAHFLAYSPSGEYVARATVKDSFFTELSHKLQVHAVKKGLPVVAPLLKNQSADVLSHNNGWILLTDQQILLFDQQATTPIKQWPLPKDTINWAAHCTIDGEQVVIPTAKGLLFCINTSNGEQRGYFPHLGVKPYSLTDIAISDCGQWLASRVDKTLVITCVATGSSWPAAQLEDQHREEATEFDYTATSHLRAGFGFIGSRLLVVEASTPREISLDKPADATKIFISEQGRPGARKPLTVSPKAPLEKLLKAADLTAFTEQLTPHWSPSTVIKSKALKKAGWQDPGENPKAPALATSRFGGWPDLPADTEWPLWQNRPMAFLAQINLAEAHAKQPELPLPNSGLLSFFIGCGEETFDNENGQTCYLVDIMLGTEPGETKGWQVIFTEDLSHLQRRRWQQTPLPETYQPCALRFSRGTASLPHAETAAYDCLTLGDAPLSDEQRDRYNQLLSRLEADPDADDSQLMGYPQLLQGTPPELMCELAATGNSPWQFPPEDSEQYRQLIRSASEWGLLLQLTSDSNADFLWGDGGHLYFFGNRAAMLAGDFSSVWINYEN